MLPSPPVVSSNLIASVLTAYLLLGKLLVSVSAGRCDRLYLLMPESHATLLADSITNEFHTAEIQINGRRVCSATLFDFRNPGQCMFSKLEHASNTVAT
ncbi:hypothetical protein F5Y18DRAFT_123030 [Xylariaceae sp. FL1019]|nr:hypothetical protein F5Y18DRAFT_123030 [Xylariaceae sp. FL1019]